MKFTNIDCVKKIVYREVFDKAFKQLIKQIGLGVHNTVDERVDIQIWIMYHEIYKGIRDEIY